MKYVFLLIFFLVTVSISALNVNYGLIITSMALFFCAACSVVIRGSVLVMYSFLSTELQECAREKMKFDHDFGSWLKVSLKEIRNAAMAVGFFLACKYLSQMQQDQELLLQAVCWIGGGIGFEAFMRTFTAVLKQLERKPTFSRGGVKYNLLTGERIK